MPPPLLDLLGNRGRISRELESDTCAHTHTRTRAHTYTHMHTHTRAPHRPQAIGEDLFSIAIDQPFRFPATFTFVLRAFSTLEGIGKGLDPDYNFSTVATPYAQELLQLQVCGGVGGAGAAAAAGVWGRVWAGAGACAVQELLQLQVCGGVWELAPALVRRSMVVGQGTGPDEPVDGASSSTVGGAACGGPCTLRTPHRRSMPCRQLSCSKRPCCPPTAAPPRCCYPHPYKRLAGAVGHASGSPAANN